VNPFGTSVQCTFPFVLVEIVSPHILAVSPYLNFIWKYKAFIKKLRGLARQRTIPTERPPLVGEVSANFRA
jgi:hypothetical protein